MYLGKLTQLRIENMKYGNLKSVSKGYEKLIHLEMDRHRLLLLRVTQKALQCFPYYAFAYNAESFAIAFLFLSLRVTQKALQLPVCQFKPN